MNIYMYFVQFAMFVRCKVACAKLYYLGHTVS